MLLCKLFLTSVSRNIKLTTIILHLFEWLSLALQFAALSH